MKKIVLFTCLSIVISLSYAQNSSYEEMMKESVNQLWNSRSEKEFLTVANKFEMISKKDESKWLPLYYLSLSEVIMCHNLADKTNIDMYLDDAQKVLDKALEINGSESELYVLQGMLYQARISVAPVSRGQKYSVLAATVFETAKTLNPDNPRIYYLSGMNILGTPKMFGGGKENALPFFNIAKEKFDNFELSDELLPNWGNVDNIKMIQYCMN